MTQPTETAVAVRTDEPFRNEFDVSQMLSSVGKLNPTKDQTAILFEAVDETDVLIRPDGLIYLDWTWYSERLTRAFPLKWGLVPQGMPKVNGDMLVWGFWLVIDGCLMGFAIGEQTRTNQKMSFTDCAEAAKSNALMRLCKGIGMSRILWHKPFVEEWKNKYAETYQDKNDRTLWKKKKGYDKGLPSENYAAATSESSGNDKPAAPVEETYHGSVTMVVNPGPVDNPTILNWAGKEVKADAKLGEGITGSAKFQSIFKFDHPKHQENHLEMHFGVKRPADLTWRQAIALYNHLHKNEDDPAYYQPKEPVVFNDSQLAEEFKRRNLPDLYGQLKNHLNQTDPAACARVLTGFLEAIDKQVFSNPPTEDEVKEMIAVLQKEFPVS
jgi:hypothetical protein